MIKYEKVYIKEKAIVEHELLSNDIDVLRRTIVGMINGIDDRKWLENKCLKFIEHNDFWVAKNAIVGLGDIARVFGELDKKRFTRS